MAKTRNTNKPAATPAPEAPAAKAPEVAAAQAPVELAQPAARSKPESAEKAAFREVLARYEKQNPAKYAVKRKALEAKLAEL